MALIYRLYSQDGSKEYVLMCDDEDEEEAKQIIKDDNLQIGAWLPIDDDIGLWPTLSLLH